MPKILESYGDKTINIPKCKVDSYHVRFMKEYAKKHKISMSCCIKEAIRIYLEKSKTN